MFRTVKAGRPVVIEGSTDTFMACLAAGEVSPVAWEILEGGLDDVVALPDEAAMAAMRMLAAPVPRRRLLRQKLIIGLLLSFVAIVALVVLSYVIGLIAFGSGALASPAGGVFTDAQALYRVAVITGFVFVSLLFAAGIAFLMSVWTDVPLGAVGTAVVIVIVSNILDAITALGSIREWLPTHYANAWLGALATDIDWTSMARGAAYSIVAFALCIGYAVYRFDRKDIVS